MSVIATDTQRLSNLIKKIGVSSTDFLFEVVTVNEAAAKTYNVGTVLGTVTATGKSKIAVETAVDGSKVASGIVVGDVLGNAGPISIAATTDTKVLVLVRGHAILADAALKWDATYDTQAKKDTAMANLKAAFVLLSTQL